MKKIALSFFTLILIAGCKPSDQEFIAIGESVVRDSLKDPDSAKFESFYKSSGELDGYVCGSVNAKNSYGGYTGKKSYYVYIEVENKKIKDHGPIIIVADDDRKALNNFNVICQR